MVLLHGERSSNKDVDVAPFNVSALNLARESDKIRSSRGEVRSKTRHRLFSNNS